MPLQTKPPGHAPQVRPWAVQLGPGSGPHIRPEHIGTHTSEVSHRPAALHVRPSAHVPHWPPHPSEPHSRPAQTGVQTQRPLALQAELDGHIPHVRSMRAQFGPGSGPHSRPAQADMHASIGGTQRPAVLHSQPARGHVPHDPPAPFGPHSRPMQFGGVVTRVHEPLVHASPATQAASQLPQCAVSVRVFTQPPPQAARPDGQAHAPATQLCPVGQRVPHPPQWRVSLCGSTQAPAHVIRGARHPDAQTPLSQLDPAPQAVPHAPQFSPSVWTFTQRSAQSARSPGQTIAEASGAGGFVPPPSLPPPSPRHAAPSAARTRLHRIINKPSARAHRERRKLSPGLVLRKAWMRSHALHAAPSVQT